MGRQRWLGLLAAAALLAGCSGGGTPGLSPELGSALAFAAYPNGNAQLVDRGSSPGSVGPFATPGNYGFRQYKTDDSPGQVVAYYHNLAAQNHWAIASELAEQMVVMTRQHINLMVTIDSDASYPPKRTEGTGCTFRINGSTSGNGPF